MDERPVKPLLDQLSEFNNNGDIKGIYCLFIDSEGNPNSCFAGELSFVERIGLLETSKYDLLRLCKNG